MTTEKTTLSYCRRCRNENHHSVLFEKIEANEDEHFPALKNIFMVLSCLGCATISFRHDFQDFDYGYHDENDNFIHLIDSQIYPPSIEGHKDLDHLYYLPNTILTIYSESLNAYKNECNILAGAGFRSVIEAICIDKKIKGRTLEQKIDNLQKEGLITKYECARLHSVRFLGNDSIHEMKEPNSSQLNAVLRITEHLLNNLYIIDKSSSNLLDNPIDKYLDFTTLLGKKMQNFKIGDEMPLLDFLEKDVRLIKEHYVAFEKTLISEINNANFKYLSIGDSKPYKNSQNLIQYYIVTEIPEISDELPF